MRANKQNKILISLMLLTSNGAVLAESPLLNVSVKPLSSILIESKQSAPASVVSLNTATISAEITGRAFKVYVKAGDTVKKNQRLVALDCRSYDLAKKQADASLKVSIAQLNLAKKQLNRNRQLLSKGTIPRELYENTLANQQTSLADIEFKKAQIETTKLAINRCVIQAPFSGQVTNKMVQQGQLLMPGTPLYQIMQSNNLEIKTKLSPADAIALKKLSNIKFVTDNKNVAVKVRSIIQLVDEATRTQEVRLTINKKTSIPTGLSGRIEWSNSKLKIPADYILRNKLNLGVMTAVNTVEGTAKAKFVVLPNAIEGQPVETDLATNTLIIDKNRYRVVDGELIRIQKE